MRINISEATFSGICTDLADVVRSTLNTPENVAASTELRNARDRACSVLAQLIACADVGSTAQATMMRTAEAKGFDTFYSARGIRVAFNPEA